MNRTPQAVGSFKAAVKARHEQDVKDAAERTRRNEVAVLALEHPCLRRALATPANREIVEKALDNYADKSDVHRTNFKSVVSFALRDVKGELKQLIWRALEDGDRMAHSANTEALSVAS
jgi:hypothetical protein